MYLCVKCIQYSAYYPYITIFTTFLTYFKSRYMIINNSPTYTVLFQMLKYRQCIDMLTNIYLINATYRFVI